MDDWLNETVLYSEGFALDCRSLRWIQRNSVQSLALTVPLFHLRQTHLEQMMKLTMLGLNCRPLAVTNTLDCHLRKPHFPRSSAHCLSLLHICSIKVCLAQGGLDEVDQWRQRRRSCSRVCGQNFSPRAESPSDPASKHIQWQAAAKEPVQQSSGATRSRPGPSFAWKHQNSLAVASFPRMAGCRPGWSIAAVVTGCSDRRSGNSSEAKTIFCVEGVAPLCLTQLDQWDWNGGTYSKTDKTNTNKKQKQITKQIQTKNKQKIYQNTNKM